MNFDTMIDQTVINFKNFSTFLHDDYRRDLVKLVEAQAEYTKSVYNFNRTLFEKSQNFLDLGTAFKK